MRRRSSPAFGIRRAPRRNCSPNSERCVGENQISANRIRQRARQPSSEGGITDASETRMTRRIHGRLFPFEEARSRDEGKHRSTNARPHRKPRPYVSDSFPSFPNLGCGPDRYPQRFIPLFPARSFRPRPFCPSSAQGGIRSAAHSENPGDYARSKFTDLAVLGESAPFCRSVPRRGVTPQTLFPL